jgi:tetratricopeptide (TPR) repeat protein
MLRDDGERSVERVANGGDPGAAPAPEGRRPGVGGAEIPLDALQLIGARYALINRIAHGGMGSVYRALDRLSGRVVTLKRLRTDDAGVGPPATLGDARLTLASEFQLLAALRHPNIVSVLDYGFDEDRMPFFAMDLEENAQPIIAAGQGQPLAVQVDLLVQVLRALVYLHRHGIIHRDLKPANVVVVHDLVKVLDFGLSVYREALEAQSGAWVGTFPYMAPEVLRGEPVTHRADLYALGMIAYELFVGAYPFDQADAIDLHEQILYTTLPRPADEVDERLRPVLARLLAKQPDDRYDSAAEVIATLAAALELPLAVETVATRESFLQAAPFVGRGTELARLAAVLRDARQGKGSAWLVAGESGVGKSRLLEETRTRALVDGMMALRGQGRGQGGGPYHVWREVVSVLALRGAPGDADAAVLAAIVPDIGRLLGRTVADAPSVDPEAAQVRLLLTVEGLFRRQPEPVVVILEDLQWVGSESLRMLSWMARVAPGLPLVLLGSHRDDEAPELSQAVEGAGVLRLSRLDATDTTALAEAMIGPAARRSGLAELLVRETEGIPFFIVEVLRALAESARGLDHIAATRLPEHVVSGGIQRVIRRRLARVPDTAVAALKTAAVVGRDVDPALLQAVHPELLINEWGEQCAAAGVLEPRDDSWRFAHDKLREQLLADVWTDALRELHRRVAEAIEGTYPGREDFVGALAHHWGQAGDMGREGEYAYAAGALALRSGACREAVGYLGRALELARTAGVAAVAGAATARGYGWRARVDPNGRVAPGTPGFRLAVVEAGLCDAHFRLGDLPACREHGLRALRHFGHAVPQGRAGFLAAAASQGVVRLVQRTVGVRSPDRARAVEVATAAATVWMRLIDTFFYSLEGLPLVWSVLGLLNQSEPIGPSPDLARGYVLAGLLAGVAPVRRLERAWCTRAVEIARETGSAQDVGWVLSRAGVAHINVGRWDEALAVAGRANEIAREVGDLRMFEETGLECALIDLHTGRLEPALERFRVVYESTLRSGSVQMRCDAMILQADTLLRLGRHGEALALCDEALTSFLEHFDQLAMRTEWTAALCTQALARLRVNNPEGAYELASRALGLLVALQPVGYWIQQHMAGVAEVLLTLIETGWINPGGRRASLERQGRQAVGVVRRFAHRIPMGRPAALIWGGLLAWIAGHRRLAMRRWRRAIDAATRLRMPYEIGRAHLEIARHLSPDAPARLGHLDQAAAVFQRLGCPADLLRVQAELDWRPVDEPKGRAVR